MRTSYSVPVGGRIAIADLTEVSSALGLLASRPTCIINRINVPVGYRSQGYGRILLALIIADADLEGYTLLLEPVATGGLLQAQLVAWYKRHGFVRHDNFFLRRDPRVERD